MLARGATVLFPGHYPFTVNRTLRSQFSPSWLIQLMTGGCQMSHYIHLIRDISGFYGIQVRRIFAGHRPFTVNRTLRSQCSPSWLIQLMTGGCQMRNYIHLIRDISEFYGIQVRIILGFYHKNRCMKQSQFENIYNLIEKKIKWVFSSVELSR